jgi:8-oxoguanine deaminase
VKTRLMGRFVVGYDGGDHVIYRDGEVVYDGDRILFVGHGYPQPIEATVDAGDAIISPGFIDLDALADIDHGILDTWQPPDLALGLQWSEEYFRHGRREVFTPDEEAFKRRYALAQLLLNGITTAMPIAAETYKAWDEPFDEMLGVADTAAELGIRLYLGSAYRSGVNVVRADGSRTVLWDEALGEAGLDRAVELARRVDGAHGGLIRGCLLPCRIETVTLDLLRRTKAHADELGCLVRIHAAQGLVERQLLWEWYGRRPIELLDELGLLGPRLSIPHVTYIRGRRELGNDGPDELAMLAESGTTVIHCPLTSVRHGRALESFDRYRSAGVNLALGTDTFPPDMLRVMDYGSNVAKLVEGRQEAGACADLFRAATLGGAKALGRDDLGRLAPGAKADIVVVDLNSLRTGVYDDPIRTLLYNAGGHNVRTVIVDGRVVVRDGEIPGLDVEEYRRRAQAYFEKYVAAYPERDYLGRPTTALFPPSLRTTHPPSRLAGR